MSKLQAIADFYGQEVRRTIVREHVAKYGWGPRTVENADMPLSTAERQKAFKDAMKEAGYVRLEAYVTKEQREKFRALGGDGWLRKKINSAKEPK